MKVLSLLAAAAQISAQLTADEQRLVTKVKKGFECTNFGIKFKVTKRQLYRSLAVPRKQRNEDNNPATFGLKRDDLNGDDDREESAELKIGIGDNCKAQFTAKTFTPAGTTKTWTEYQYEGEFKWFTTGDASDDVNWQLPEGENDNAQFEHKGEKGYERCGGTLVQDEFGIVYELHVKGVRAKSSPAPYTARTMIFSCFYPMANTNLEDLPLDLQKYMLEEPALGAASYQFRSYANLTQIFEVRDLRDRAAEKYNPSTNGFANPEMSMDTGDAIVVGAKPMADAEGTNYVGKFPSRFDYFFRDCVWSAEFDQTNADGTTTKVQRDIPLIKRNCKSSKYNVQMLTKYGQGWDGSTGNGADGHVMMFEAIAFEGDTSHWLTCDIDICLKTRTGAHAWPGCYQPCRRAGFIEQRADESNFALTTTTVKVEATEVTTTRFQATENSQGTPRAPLLTTHMTTLQAPVDPNFSEAVLACQDIFFNGHFYAGDERMQSLCNYIRQHIEPDHFLNPLDETHSG